MQGAYSVFKEEVAEVTSDYSPNTINTDGWAATVKVMKTLFSHAVLIRCFLHAFLKVRNTAKKKTQEVFDVCAEKIWECYKSQNKKVFSQRIRRLKEWTLKTIDIESINKAIIKLCNRRKEFSVYYDNTLAHRTSNMLDRLMKFMNRRIFKAQGFHGSMVAANKNMRAYALLYNFTPCSPKAVKGNLKSPAEKLNGFAFSENWLENLLIASSLNGRRRNQSIKK